MEDWNFGLRKKFKHFSEAYWAILVGTWKTVIMRAVDCGGSAQESSEEKNVSSWSKDHWQRYFDKECDCFCPEDLPEANLKRFGLMALTEEISRQHNFVLVV